MTSHCSGQVFNRQIQFNRQISLRACVRARGMRAGMGQVRVVGEGRGVRCEVSSVRCGER